MPFFVRLKMDELGISVMGDLSNDLALRQMDWQIDPDLLTAERTVIDT